MSGRFRIMDFRPHHADHLLHLGVRPEDIQEWETATDMPFAQALRLATKTDYCRTVLWDRTAVAIFGVSHDDGVTPSHVWLAGAKLTLPLGLHFLEHREAELARLHVAGGPTLWAFADLRNHKHHGWLKALGFFPAATVHFGGHPYTVYKRGP